MAADSRRRPKSKSVNELHSRPSPVKPPPRRRAPQPKATAAAATRKDPPPKQTLSRTAAIKELNKTAAQRRGSGPQPAKPPRKPAAKLPVARPAGGKLTTAGDEHPLIEWAGRNFWGVLGALFSKRPSLARVVKATMHVGHACLNSFLHRLQVIEW